MRIGPTNNLASAPGTAPIAPADEPAKKPAPGRDTLALTRKVPAPAAKPPVEENLLETGTGRRIVDVTSTVASTADGARGVPAAVEVVKTASEAGKLGRFSAFVARFSTLADEAVAAVVAYGGRAPRVVGALGRVANAAPILGVVVAGFDIGRAVIEKNPEKKMRAEGMAVLSTTSAVAGVLGAAGVAGATVAGVALAPIAVPAMVVGGVLTAVTLADSFLLGGAISKGISRGLRSLFG